MQCRSDDDGGASSLLALANMKSFAVVFVLGCLFMSNAAGSSGFEFEFDVRSHLGTKTSYASYLLHRDGHSCSAREAELHAYATDNACSPRNAYFIFRHGTRFPTAKKMAKLQNTERSFAVVFGEEEASRLLRIPTPFRAMDAGLLTPKGVDEMVQLGKRTRQRFKSLFENREYHPMTYDIYSTEVLRTSQSAHAFAEGFFNGKVPSNFAVVSKSSDHDRVLRFHKSCPKYLARVKRNKTVTGPDSESAKYWDAVGNEIAEKVSAALSALREEAADKDALAVDADTALRLWSSCVYQASSLDDPDGMCRIFDDADVSKMEFMDDIDAY